MRLFLAIEIPDIVKDKLIAYQPGANKHIRLTEKNKLHITLHFLGNINPALLDKALRGLSLNTFTIQLNGTGLFNKVNPILWVGVKNTSALLKLHNTTQKLLKNERITLEHRKYRPHITLARCKTGFDIQANKNFLNQKTEGLSFDVTHLSLFSSEFKNGQHQYRKLQQWELN